MANNNVTIIPPHIQQDKDGLYILDSYSKVLDYILCASNTDEVNLSNCILVPSSKSISFEIKELVTIATANGYHNELGFSLKENRDIVFSKRFVCNNSVLRNAFFTNTKFEQFVNLDNSILEDVNFTNSSFSSGLSLSNTKICGYFSLKHVVAKSIYLHSANYEGACFDFTYSRIKSISILSSVFKYSESNIKEAKEKPGLLHFDFNFAHSILGNVLISDLNSELYLSFLNADIKDEIRIHNCTFFKGLVFENCILEGSQVIIADVNTKGIKDNVSINFRECQINTDLVLNGIYFDFIDLTGCKIEKSGRLSIFYSSLNNINFVRAVIFGEVSINHINPKISSKAVIDMSCTLNLGNIYVSGLENINVANYDTAKILRLAAQNMKNSIEVTSLSAIEHNLFLKENRLSFSSISDYLLLWLNKLSNNFGTNWIRGIIFCVTVATIFTGLIGLTSEDYIFCVNPKEWVIFSEEFWVKTFEFLWLPNLDSYNALELLPKYNARVLMYYIIGKSLIAYGIFQTVVAFRKYCGK